MSNNIGSVPDPKTESVGNSSIHHSLQH